MYYNLNIYLSAILCFGSRLAKLMQAQLPRILAPLILRASASNSNGKSGSANLDTNVGMSESSGEVEVSPRNKVNARLLMFVVAHINISSHLLGVTM